MSTSETTATKDNVETSAESPVMKKRKTAASPSTSTSYLEMEDDHILQEEHIQDPEGESSDSFRDGELAKGSHHEYIQVREQYPITSSGLPMHTTIITPNDGDLDADKVIIFEDGSIKRRKFKEMVEDTFADVLTTVRDCVDRQSVASTTNNETLSSQTQTMLNHFSRFVASSLVGLPSRKRNSAIAHITAYLTDLRSEEEL